MSEAVSFEYIRKIQIEEQKSNKLTKISEKFYENVAEYLKRKRSFKKTKKDEIEIKNIERIIENIIDRRERKIVNLAIIAAIADIQPENLIPEEREFFTKLVEIIKERRERLLNKIFEKESKNYESLVVFKEDVPAFVGIDGKVYGPFKRGDIARIPEQHKKLLLEKGLIEEFKIES